jgi:hypothetical protein
MTKIELKKMMSSVVDGVTLTPSTEGRVVEVEVEVMTTILEETGVVVIVDATGVLVFGTLYTLALLCVAGTL